MQFVGGTVRLRAALIILAAGASLLVLLDLQFRSDSTLRRLTSTAGQQKPWETDAAKDSQTDEDLAVTQGTGSWTNLTTALEELMPNPEIKWKGDGWKAATQQAIRKLLLCLAEYGDECQQRPEGKVVIVE